MADKRRFGPELYEAEIDASVEELLILEFLMKQLLDILQGKLYCFCTARNIKYIEVSVITPC